MFVFVIALHILFPDGERQDFRIYSPSQYSPDVCFKMGADMIDLLKEKIPAQIEAEVECERIETRPI